MLDRKEAEKQRALIAEAAQMEAEWKQRHAEQERLEAVATLIEFLQQKFIKEQSTQRQVLPLKVWLIAAHKQMALL